MPRDCRSVEGEIEVFREYEPGLRDVDGFSHLVVLWLFHLSESSSLIVKPLYFEGRRGIFATRHPDRPNPIGFSVVELLERRENVLRVKGLDATDGTPVLDIKPYLSIDSRKITKGGWLDKETQI